MGSPPCRKRSTVDPLTVMMSSLPSLSQSIRPTPPLIDSTIYFLSGDEMWETLSPAFCATSSNWGTGDCLGGGGGGADCAGALIAIHKPTHRPNQVRIGEKIFRLYPPLSAMVPTAGHSNCALYIRG